MRGQQGPRVYKEQGGNGSAGINLRFPQCLLELLRFAHPVLRIVRPYAVPGQLGLDGLLAHVAGAHAADGACKCVGVVLAAELHEKGLQHRAGTAPAISGACVCVGVCVCVRVCVCV